MKLGEPPCLLRPIGCSEKREPNTHTQGNTIFILKKEPTYVKAAIRPFLKAQPNLKVVVDGPVFQKPFLAGFAMRLTNRTE